MNAGLSDDHVSIRYYDSDYPWRETTPIPENFDPITERQGLAHDVTFFVRRAHEAGGPVLELCSGTGRVAIPLARAGFEVAAVDLSPAMLDRHQAKLDADPNDHQARYDLALALDAKGDRDGALNALLEIVKRDRKWNDEGARKHLVTLFEAMGPTDPRTIEARRRLSAILFS